MSLTKQEEDEVKEKVIAKFGQDLVEKIDMKYMALADIRAASESSYDFLAKVKDTYPDQAPEILLAGILFGMKMGELGVLYAQEKGLIEVPKTEKKDEHAVKGYTGDYSEQMYG